MIEHKNLNNNQILELLNSESNDDKLEVLDYLLTQDNVDEYVQQICNLVTNPDKGIRNAASLIIVNHRPEKAAQYLVQLVSSKDISLRNLAGELLIKIGPKAINALIDFNCEKNSDDQKFVIDVLGLIGSAKAADHIIGIMGSTEDDNVILACIEALGNIRHQESLDILQLLYERNELYKPFIVEAIGKIGSPKGCSFLLEKFQKEDEITKYSILESLGFVGDVDTFYFLLEQVPNIHGPLVWPLITSLFILKEKYNLDIPFDDKMKNLLMYTLQEGTPEHKKTALSLINVFNDKDILVESLKFLGDDDELDEIIRSKIYKNPEYLFEEFQRIISNSNDKLRQILNLYYSILSYLTYEVGKLDLSLIQKRNIIYAMSELLSHYDEEIRRSSMEIIFLLDSEAALLFVDSMLKDENMWNRLRLVELLEPINNKISKDALLKMINDSEDMIRERVQELINNLNINETNPNLR